jgi:hypothetical protein
MSDAVSDAAHLQRAYEVDRARIRAMNHSASIGTWPALDRSAALEPVEWAEGCPGRANGDAGVTGDLGDMWLHPHIDARAGGRLTKSEDSTP